MQARCQGDKCAYCRFMYLSWLIEPSESTDESESEDVNCVMSYNLLLQILTFLLFCAVEPNLFSLDLISVYSGSPIWLCRMLVNGVMHGVNYCVAEGVTYLAIFKGDLLPFLTDLLLADLLRDLDLLNIFFFLVLLLLLLGFYTIFLFLEIDLLLDLGTCVMLLFKTLNF